VVYIPSVGPPMMACSTLTMAQAVATERLAAEQGWNFERSKRIHGATRCTANMEGAHFKGCRGIGKPCEGRVCFRQNVLG